MAKKIPPADPQTCASCKFFQGNKIDEFGFCRRYPPVSVVDDEGGAWTIPVTTEDEYCGEFVQKTH